MARIATTIDEQIDILRSRNVIICDEDKAREVLADVGYYRLCTYFFPFEITYPNHQHRNHMMQDGTRFEDAVLLYYFDTDLRRIVQHFLTRIEVSLRTNVVYDLSNYFKPNFAWYVDDTLVDGDQVRYIQRSVYTNTFKQQRPVIRRHHAKYPGDEYAPAWKALENMTFGAVLTLLNKVHSIDAKRTVAAHYGIRALSTFENYFEHICTVRNICAHGSALFDIRLNTAIASGPAGVTNANKQNLQGVLMLVNYVLEQISVNRAREFRADVSDLFEDLHRKNPKVYAQIVPISGYNAEFFKNMHEKFAYFKKMYYLCSRILKKNPQVHL